jgi:hypothetical protein
VEKMGTIEVFVYEGNLHSIGSDGYNNCSDTMSSFQQYHEENRDVVVPISKIDGGGKEKSFVLSKPGSQIISENTARNGYHWGKCIDVIKLRYCTTTALMLAGVIANPLAITWRCGVPPRRSVSLSPEGSPSSMTRPTYHTEMHRIVGDPTPDGNVPHRTVELIVIESDESDFDVDDDDM